jgi:hypothetical protein
MSSGTPLVVLLLGLGSLVQSAAADSHLMIHVRSLDGATLPCRVHLQDAEGKPLRAEALPFWNDHFVCPGEARVALSPGEYSYEIERGPEYIPATGKVTITAGKDHQLIVELKRRIDMAARHWWSGELHIHRPIEQVPLHLQAEDLHIGPTITWWNGRDLWRERDIPERTHLTVDGDRHYDVMGGEDEREGGALLYFGLKKPLTLPGGRGQFPEHPSPMKFLNQAREQKDVWIDIEKPFWWDVPIWLASGKIDSIGLANNHMCRSRMYESEAWGRPRDSERLPVPRGNGLWTQEIYYHILNCGLRIPPSAGSASGVLPNPVGYNRVYVHTGKPLDWDEWWSGLKAGRSFVTNGPLLICRANGHLPGHVMSTDAAANLVELSIEVTSNDRVSAVEIVSNGKTVSLSGKSLQSGTIKTSLKLQPGWFLVRAITDRAETFRFASTAPWYIESTGQPRRISRRSVEFFVNWVEERAERVPMKLDDAAKLSEVLAHHDQARRFWNDRLNLANAP